MYGIMPKVQKLEGEYFAGVMNEVIDVVFHHTPSLNFTGKPVALFAQGRLMNTYVQPMTRHWGFHRAVWYYYLPFGFDTSIIFFHNHFIMRGGTHTFEVQFWYTFESQSFA